MQTPRGLGRGLSALMGEMPLPVASQTVSTADAAHAPTTLSLTQLKPGPYQPRRYFSDENLKELATSIEQNGVMQPIIVRLAKGEEASGLYEIIAGERRWRASKLAGKTTIPVIIKAFTDREALAFSLIENIQREDLSPIEEAEGYLRLMQEFQYTQEAIAHAVAKSRSHIANLLRLLQLPLSIRQYIVEGKISVGHARTLVGNPDAESLAERIIAENASVREVEKWVQQSKPGAQTKKPRQSTSPSVAPAARDPELIEMETQLSDNLGMPVRIEDSPEGGVVTIHFTHMEQLDTILQCLMSGAPASVRTEMEASQ